MFPNASNSECQNLPFPLQINQLKVNLKSSWRILSLHPASVPNGLACTSQLYYNANAMRFLGA